MKLFAKDNEPHIADIVSNLVTSKNRESIANELKIGMILSRTYIKIEQEKNNSEKPKDQEENNNEKLEIKNNDIIIKRVSPLYVTIITDLKDNQKLNLGPNLTRIRVINPNYYPSFVASYIDYKLETIVRKDAKMPLLMLQQLKDLDIPMISKEKQEIIGNAWVLNSKQKDIDTELINKEFEYNQNLILRSLEALNG